MSTRKLRDVNTSAPFKDTTTPTFDGAFVADELQVQTTPLQLPSQDEVLRRYQLGGPDKLRDVRMYLDLADLEHLVEMARKSPARRVVLPSAGIVMEVHRSRGGHIYEVLKVVSRQPQPERTPTGILTRNQRSRK